MNKNITILAIVVIVLLAGAILAYNAYQSNKITQPVLTNTQPTSQPTPSDLTIVTETPSSNSSSESTPASNITVQTKNTVLINVQGFSPQNITVNKGDSITWINNDSVNHTVNSDNHPSHLLFPFLNGVGVIKPDERKTLVFTNSGFFTYHDHLNAALTGKVTVK